MEISSHVYSRISKHDISTSTFYAVLPEELEVGDRLGVVAHGVAELDHGLAEVGEAVCVHFKLTLLQLKGNGLESWLSPHRTCIPIPDYFLNGRLETQRSCRHAAHRHDSSVQHTAA